MQVNDLSAIILLYHGVTTSPSVGIENYSGKHLPTKEFEHHMDYLKQKATLLTLRELAAHLQKEEPLPPNSVAVTFDDTFKNVYDVALPILRQYQIPATFFVSTGLVGTNRRFWVDQVEHMINMTKHEAIELSLNSGSRCYPLRTPSEKTSAVIEIKDTIKQMKVTERHRTLASLQDCIEVTDNGDTVPNYANLSWDDVCKLDDPPFYEVGGHTVNHEILSYLNYEALRYEVWECKNSLEQHLGHTADLFSYPEGQEEHFNQRVISELKSAGITICPTAISGVNHRGTDPFYLKRIMVGYMGRSFPFPDF